ncbi:MAG: cupin domain-containing protein [Pseudomonadota bacterium]
MTEFRPVVILTPETASEARQGMPQFFGISGASANASGISMNLTAFPPGGRAKVHYHRDFETAIYGITGRIALHWGMTLENACLIAPGTFCFIPPEVPHVAFNLSLTEPASAITARNDPAEQENVVTVPALDQRVDALMSQYPELARPKGK